AGGESVEALLGDDAEEIALRGAAVALDDVPGREIAGAHVEHLALRDELLHRLPDLFPGCFAIDVVHLVEVDPVRAEAAQALLARAPDVNRRQPDIVRPGTHSPVHLGGQHDAVAPAAVLCQPAADDLLGHTLAALPAVDVGGIEEVEAELERPVHDREALALRRLGAEVHRAEAEAAHLESRASELRVL